MKILVFTYNFKPDPSPTAYCLELILSELGSNYDITVITSSEYIGEELEIQSNEKIKVVRISDPLKIHNTKVVENDKNSKFLLSRVFFKGVKYFNSLLNRVYFLFYPDGGFFWRKKVARELKNVINVKEYSIFVSSIGFYSTFKLAEDMKKNNRNAKIISYLNDPLPINNPFVNSALHLYDSKSMSRKCIENSSYIMANNSIYQKYVKDYFSEFENKFHEIDIPLLKNNSDGNFDKFEFKGNQDTIKIVYSGSFYKEIRNPLIPITLILQSTKNTSLHIMGNLNDCEDIIIELSRKFPERIFFYGSIDRKLLFRALNSTDYLLNIGNHLENQVPSKLFEYMATGKPIIHFYTLAQDTCLPYLDKYKLSLALDLSEQKNEQTKLIHNFVCENINKKISFIDINHTFLKNTPKFSAQKVSDILNEMS